MMSVTTYDREAFVTQAHDPTAGALLRNIIIHNPERGTLLRHVDYDAPSRHGVIHSSARFSKCERYRYTLRRVWYWDRPQVAFIGLNPSTADHIENDPTVTRCIKFAQSWQFGGMFMLNIFAYRATDPKEMKRQLNPEGEYNMVYLREIYRDVGMTVACWGAHGAHMDQGEKVAKALDGLYCLGRTKDGHPKHPLYLRAETRPVPFNL